MPRSTSMTDDRSPSISMSDGGLDWLETRGRWGAIWIAIIYFLGFSLVWTIAHELSDLHGTRLPLTFQWESRIPLQRWAIPLYFTLDLSVILLPLVFRSDMPTGVWGAYLFEPLGMKNVSQWNQTPSLHVTYSLTVATVIARRWGGIWWCIGFAWAIPVSITTMLVHEHHLICVAGGLLLFAMTIPLLGVWDRHCGLDDRGRDVDRL